MGKPNAKLRMGTRREAYRQMISKSPILASEGWHCFVTVVCLLMCIGFLQVGLSGLEFLGDHGFGAGKTIQHGPVLGLVGMVVLSARGCEFCLRELWRSAAAYRRKQRG